MSYITNARGLRIGKFRKWQTTWYFEQQEYVQNIHNLLNIQKYIENIFAFLKNKIILTKFNYISLGKKNIYIILSYYNNKDSNKNYKFIKNLKNDIINFKTQKLKHLTTIYKNRNNKTIMFKNNFKNQLYISYKYRNLYFQKKISLKKKFYKIKYTKKINKKFNRNIKIKEKSEILNYILNNNSLNNNNFYNNIKENNILYNYNKNLFNNNKNILQYYLKNTQNIQKFSLNNYEIQWIIYKQFIIHLLNIMNLKKNELKQNYLKNNLELILKQKIKNKQMNFFTNNINKKNYLKINNKKINYNIKKNDYKKKNRLIIKNLNNIKNELSILCNSNVNIILINSLNLLFFNFKDYSVNFLHDLLYKKAARFKQETKNVKDIVYLIMISFFFKDAALLAKILNFIFKTSKKKAKHWRLINFIKIILSKVSSFYNDINAYKIKIKGRINHSRRSRFIYIQKNLIPNQTFNNFIDYGYMQTKTKSGTLGIKVWLFFKENANNNYRKTLIEYINYSKIIKQLKNV